MGLPSLSEYDLRRASEEEVRSCARIVHGLAGAFAPPPPHPPFINILQRGDNFYLRNTPQSSIISFAERQRRPGR